MVGVMIVSHESVLASMPTQAVFARTVTPAANGLSTAMAKLAWMVVPAVTIPTANPVSEVAKGRHLSSWGRRRSSQ
jgi:hypothetical protein